MIPDSFLGLLWYTRPYHEWTRWTCTYTEKSRIGQWVLAMRANRDGHELVIVASGNSRDTNDSGEFCKGIYIRKGL